MLTVQFSTQLTSTGEFSVPDQYLKSIPTGTQVQVILLVDSPAPSADPSVAKNDTVPTDDGLPSLGEYVAYLRNQPLPKTLITPAKESLHDYLIDSSNITDADFDENAWNAQWDQMEAAMDADIQADEQKLLTQLTQD